MSEDREKAVAATGCSEQRSFLRVGKGAPQQIEMTMVHEKSIEILLNGSFIMRTQCFGRDVEHMAVGYLACEGMLQQRSDLKAVEVDMSAGSVNVVAEVSQDRVDYARSCLSVTAGGGRMAAISVVQKKLQYPQRRASGLQLRADQVLALFTAFDEQGALYRETRFVHAAGLGDGERLLCFFDDIGRHNAIDKAIGWGFGQARDLSQLALVCSGRFSLEMVAKAAGMGIPVFISPAAPSIEAVALADSAGMMLCGRTSETGFNVYSHQERII